jgi:hypothetical protein
MKMILLAVFVLVATVVNSSGQTTAVANPDEHSDRKAAIFVFSREPKVGNQQVKMLEDLIAARVSSQGFQALTRDTIVDSISKSMQQPGPGISENEKQFLSQLTTALTTPAPLEKSVEDQLDEQSSVMRLAQTIGANLIVISVVESFGTEKRTFKGNDLAPIATTVISNNLLVSYRLAFAATGGSVAGDAIRVTRSWRETDGLSRETDDLLNGMFDEVAGDLAKKISAANLQVKDVPKVQSTDVQFNVKLVLPGGAPLLLPTYENGNVQLPVSATVAADVLMDGVSVGSVPGGVHVTTGLHQISVQSAGFKPWRRFVNVSEGQRFDVLMEMTPESYDKWKEVIGFLSDLSRMTKLTDAEVKQMQAKADAMRQAGLIVTVGNNGTEMIRK